VSVEDRGPPDLLISRKILFTFRYIVNSHKNRFREHVGVVVFTEARLLTKTSRLTDLPIHISFVHAHKESST
jgi:hypothetical protein